VLLMSPLPVHGRDANLIADITKALLDHGVETFTSSDSSSSSLFKK
jgi:hypothetical protein